MDGGAGKIHMEQVGNEKFFFLLQTIDGKVHFVYKKVAMVEQFFDIIYSVHVEAAGDTQIRGRAGKHCGQKRTYRAVSIHIFINMFTDIGTELLCIFHGDTFKSTTNSDM